MDFLAALVGTSPFALGLASACNPVPLDGHLKVAPKRTAFDRQRPRWEPKGDGHLADDKPKKSKKSKKKHKRKSKSKRKAKSEQAAEAEDPAQEEAAAEEEEEEAQEVKQEAAPISEEEKESEGEDDGEENPKERDDEWTVVSKTRQGGSNKHSITFRGVSIQLPHNGADKVSVWIPQDWKNAARGLEPERPTDEIRERWRKQQRQLSSSVVLTDDFDWSLTGADGKRQLRYVGGVDISFAKNSKIDACASIVVCAFPSMEVVYETYSMCKLTAPYIAGLLAFREVPFIQEIVEKMRKEVPDMLPDVLLVDGNGLLHMRLFGLACHLGVMLGMPTIGVGKTLLYADNITDEVVSVALRDASRRPDPDGGIWGLLKGRTVEQLAYAYKHPKKTNSKILYISAGHKISLQTARALVNACMLGKFGHYLPAPVQYADGLSRDFLKDNYSRLAKF